MPLTTPASLLTQEMLSEATSPEVDTANLFKWSAQ